MKLETPEARSMVRLLNDFDPHVMMDLHTTNGSRHAYHLTYEVPNNPAVDDAIARLAQTRWLPAVSRSIKTRDGWDYRAYGNVTGDAPNRSWTTVEDLPRYSHNYWGLRNRVGILSEAYSYLTFQERIAATTRFVDEVLDFAHANASEIRKTTDTADAVPPIGRRLSLRSRPKRSDRMVEILMGEIEEDIHPFTGRVMFRRTDVRRPEQMWEYATFEAAESERVPSAYFVPAELQAVGERLRAHGIRLERLGQASTIPVEEFRIASTEIASQVFENHRERTVTGQYAATERSLPPGTWRVPMNQPLARLAFYLLEPRSNDGLLTWNLLDETLKDAQVYPILRARE
jgi:hypothetical protein